MTGVSSVSPVSSVPAPAPAGAVAQAAPVTPAVAQVVDPKVAEAAKGFEAVFMTMLADEMFKGTEITSGNPMYSGLMTQQFGSAMADSGGLGLAAMLTKQLGGEA